MVQGYAGSTPYVRWGNVAVMLLITAILGFAWIRYRVTLGQERKKRS
jgi:apolipoprotein N-acyltransferase